MSKSAKKRPAAPSPEPVSAAKPAATVGDSKTKKQTAAVLALRRPTPKVGQMAARDSKTKNVDHGSKQSRVLAMLQSPAGATIAAMIHPTGWQQHSVRGFLAGVVRKRLKLNLASKKVDGSRVYQIASQESGKSAARQPKRRAA
jgi:Protein of unknown function (DUF3489)